MDEHIKTTKWKDDYLESELGFKVSDFADPDEQEDVYIRSFDNGIVNITKHYSVYNSIGNDTPLIKFEGEEVYIGKTIVKEEDVKLLTTLFK